MASQQAPSRPWLRLTSIARPVVPPAPAPQPLPQAPPPAPAPAPAPAPEPQPRPAMSLSAFRPTAPPPPPPQPQELPPPPPPPPPMSSPPPPPPPPSVPRSPPQQPVEPLPDVSTGTLPRTTTASVPSTPLVRTIAAPTSSLPASPAKLPSAPPPPAVTSSPVKPQVPSPARRSPIPSPPKPSIIEPTIAMPAQMPMPMPSPKVVKPAAQTPPQSPSVKPVAPPPSPLVLPPPKLRADDQPRIPQEAEQKTVLVQETVPLPPPTSRLPSLNGRIHEIPKAGIARDTKNGDAERHRGPHPKKHLDSGEVPSMKVITLAGENKGATMELTRSPKHPPSHHLLHNKASPTSKSNGQESRISSLPSGRGSSSSDEGNQKMQMKDKSQQSKSLASPPVSAFMNSNVQGVNNSILYNSSCTHHDPGVHLALSRKPSNGSLHIKDLVKGGHQP